MPTIDPQRSPRWANLQSRALPPVLVERPDFRWLAEPRRRYIHEKLLAIEREVVAIIEAWFSYPPQERIGDLSPVVFLSGMEAYLGLAQQEKYIDAPGENFSWWIFRDSWWPDTMRERSIAALLPEGLRRRLNQPVPEIGVGLNDYLAWLQRQNTYLGEALDRFYDAKNYDTVYIQICAIFIYLAGLGLTLQHARLDGYFADKSEPKSGLMP